MINKFVLFYFFVLTMIVQPIDLPSVESEFTEGLSKFQIERIHSFDTETQTQFKANSSLISKGLDTKIPPFNHILKEANYSKSTLTLMDDSVWNISWWYKGSTKNWEAGDRLKIYFDGSFGSFLVQNVDKNKTTWVSLKEWPASKQADTIYSLHTKQPDIQKDNVSVKIALKSGWIFQLNDVVWDNGWSRGDIVVVLEKKGWFNDSFVLVNVSLNEYIEGFSLIGYETHTGASRAEILSLQKRLNDRVISQEHATKAVADALINAYSGLRDPNTPVGVFLFLGPTGVGKTELVKVLSDELYKTQSRVVRFDMSQLNTPWSVSRLIGSEPGYVDSHEGGQLTNPLLEQPESIVLLDEIEKAHDEVRKFFLPIFDEGHLKDAQGHQVDATQAMFFMTSNIASTDIIDLYNQGYDEGSIQAIIEPQLIKKLSPELYNRVQPVIFRPLTEEAINKLVDLMLEKIIVQVKTVKNIDLTISDSAKEYLAKEGYHPILGARPLKRLIQKKVIANISYAIVEQDIPNGCAIFLDYFSDEDLWDVVVSKD